MKHFTRAALLFSLWLAAGTAAAALQVEIMVFKPAAAKDDGLAWEVAAPLPACHAVRLRESGGAETPFLTESECAKVAGQNPQFTGYGTAVATPALATAAGKLEAAGQKPLINRAWRQAGALSPVLLQGGADFDGQPEVRGTVTVVPADKYSEVTLDLVITRLNADSGLPEFLRVSEVRKMKSGEPHYLDHPLLGAIVQVIDTELEKKPR